MVDPTSPKSVFPSPASTLDRSHAPAEVRFPIQHVEIDWGRLIAKRALVLETVDEMPRYLLYPEVVVLLAHEKHPTYRLIMDLMWTTGARVSEVLALTPSCFIDDGYDVGVVLRTLKRMAGRPSKVQLRRDSKRYIPIKDMLLLDRIACYLREHPRRKEQRMFTMCRQTVNRHIEALAEEVGDLPFRVSSHTFRHSFAIHLILHGRPLKYVSQLLGHKSVSTTEIYTNVLTVDGGYFLEGVDFH